ncbi:F0F1 ATP synthase subunit B [Candidatus Saccharibacteria bacterium]|nr:F0F1 ATP synthase subunit B [Candidatus Saccharibacteria bacterium]
MTPLTNFGESSSGGISSLGLNLKAFIFQLITFLIVLLILKKFVWPKIVTTLEERRKTLEQSLADAKATEESLQQANVKSAEILQAARVQADAALAEASTRAEDIIAKGEAAAGERVARVIKEAEERLEQDRQKLHDELKAELAGLVAAATEKVLQKKINEREDRALIEQSLKEIG